MPKLKWNWMRSKNAVFMSAREERIRAHRERISIGLRARGLKEGDGLKTCCIHGCLQETIECFAKRLAKWGWKQIDGEWYCPAHAKHQKEAC